MFYFTEAYGSLMDFHGHPNELLNGHCKADFRGPLGNKGPLGSFHGNFFLDLETTDKLEFTAWFPPVGLGLGSRLSNKWSFMLFNTFHWQPMTQSFNCKFDCFFEENRISTKKRYNIIFRGWQIINIRFLGSRTSLGITIGEEDKKK